MKWFSEYSLIVCSLFSGPGICKSDSAIFHILISLVMISTLDSSPRLCVSLQPCVPFCVDVSLLFRCEWNCHYLILSLYLRRLCFPRWGVTFYSLISLYRLSSRCLYNDVLIGCLLCLSFIFFFFIKLS